jgi:hypothetical protein
MNLQSRTEIQQRAAEKRLLSRQAARKRKLAEAGIVYNFDKVGYVSAIVRCPRSLLKRSFPVEKAQKHIMTTLAAHVLGYDGDYGVTSGHS